MVGMKKEGIVVSVGAGMMQSDFIRTLKQRGYRVAAFGHGKNSQDAIDNSEYFADIDTADAQSAIEWINSLGEKVIAVGSYAGGVAIKTLQEISSYYGLTTEVPKELMIGMNKIEQQILYRTYGLSHIDTYSVKDIKNQADAIIKEKEYIIKPVIGRGSDGVRIVKGSVLFELVEDNALNEDDIVQSVVYGNEYRVLLMAQDGEIKLLAPICRTSYKDTFFLGRLEVKFDDYNRIEEHAKKMLKDMQIRNSIIKYDIIVGSDSINLIEMDIGVGGGFYFKKYISMVYEHDLMNVYIDLICGNKLRKMECVNEKLIMDYIYNEHNCPVSYEFTDISLKLKDVCGENVVLQNRLHPEKKSIYESNADFLFAVIYEKREIDLTLINDYVNDKVLVESGK